MDCIIFDTNGTLLILPANFRATLNPVGQKRFDEGRVLGTDSGRELDEIAVESFRVHFNGEHFDISRVLERVEARRR